MVDEYHLLFECANNLVKENRKKVLPKSVTDRPNMYKCISLLNDESIRCKNKFSLFLKNVLLLYK